MAEESGTLERRGLARGLKICLDILFYIVLAVGILLAGGLTISLFSDYDDGWEIRAPVAVGETSLFSRLPVEIEMDVSPAFENPSIWEAQGKLRFLHYSLPLHLGESAASFLTLGILLWAITILRRILATTAGGHPFDPKNPRRLNTLGWILLLSSVLTSFLQYLASRWILSKVEVTTFPLSPLVQVYKEWILCGLLVLVLAAIWKQAVQMAEDQSLTV